MPISTATAEPLLDPPGVCCKAGSQGFRVGDGSKQANSTVTVLPRMIAPARRKAATNGASAVARWFARSGEPARVYMPATSMMSLMPKGMPCSGPR